MATTYYFSTTVVTAGKLYELITSAPASANEADGWQPAVGDDYKFADFTPGAINNTWSYSASGRAEYGFRVGPLSGSFAAGDWAIYNKVKNDANYVSGQAGIVKYAAYKSSNADGTSPTLIADENSFGWFYTTFTAANQYISTNPGDVKATLGTVSLTNEYLFFVISFTRTAAGGTGAQVFFVNNDGTQKLVLPTFTEAPTGITIDGVSCSAIDGVAVSALQ